jgi:hypothetical protein
MLRMQEEAFPGFKFQISATQPLPIPLSYIYISHKGSFLKNAQDLYFNIEKKFKKQNLLVSILN